MIAAAATPTVAARRANRPPKVAAAVSVRWFRFTVLVLPSGGYATVQPKVQVGSFRIIAFVE
jgi:hypothetical protein